MKPLKFLQEMLELLGEDLTQTRFFDRRVNGNLRFDKKKADGELGRGLFSAVTPDPKDPHMVQKKTIAPLGPKHALGEDGFSEYVEMLAARGLMDNIHFPKVYRAQTSTDRAGTKRQSYTIERLEDISKISGEELDALAERCFSRPVYNSEGIADRIDQSCRGDYGRRTYIKMETLYEACEAIEQMSKESRFSLDIHTGNIMVRRTPHGLQLVITDPFGLLKNGHKN